MKDEVIAYGIVDEKNRLTIPQEIIALYNDFLIMPWLDKKLYLSSRENIGKISEAFNENSFDQRNRLVIRKIISLMTYPNIDSKNRIALPLCLCRYAGITKGSTVCFVQKEDHVELYAENKE